jgi:membrane protein YqaA with SNARE-associated domain
VPASLIFWRSCSPLEINARKSGVSGNQATHLFVTRKPMSLEDHVHGFTPHIVEFVRAHEMWAAPIFGALAFGESLAFISLVLPAWAVLVTLGTLIAQGGINFWPVWVAGSVGAALGDWLSYWIGSKLGPPVAHIWPLSRHPDLLPRGERFVSKWGPLAIFIGRFSGPLRAVAPLVAGIFGMPFWHFKSPISFLPSYGARCCSRWGMLSPSFSNLFGREPARYHFRGVAARCYGAKPGIRSRSALVPLCCDST